LERKQVLVNGIPMLAGIDFRTNASWVNCGFNIGLDTNGRLDLCTYRAPVIVIALGDP